MDSRFQVSAKFPNSIYFFSQLRLIFSSTEFFAKISFDTFSYVRYHICANKKKVEWVLWVLDVYEEEIEEGKDEDWDVKSRKKRKLLKNKLIKIVEKWK